MEPKPIVEFAHVLGIQLMITYWFDLYSSNIIVVWRFNLQRWVVIARLYLIWSVFIICFYILCVYILCDSCIQPDPTGISKRDTIVKIGPGAPAAVAGPSAAAPTSDVVQQFCLWEPSQGKRRPGGKRTTYWEYIASVFSQEHPP